MKVKKSIKVVDKSSSDKVCGVVNEFDKTKVGKSFFSIGYWVKRGKMKLYPHRTLLINMELINGFHSSFIVIDKDGGFKYRDKKYIFDEEVKYYDISSGMWCYDYNEELSVPIKRKIPTNEIKKVVESSGITEVEYMLNPSTLERFTVAKIAEGVMKGQQIDEFFKQIRLLLVITCIAAIMHLLLFAWKSGMLDKINIPGL